MNLSVKQIERKATQHRKKILKMINLMGKGHIGGAFSCIDLLSSLYYGNILNVSPNNFNDPNHHRLLLSKGHASIAQYVILQDLGFFDEKELFKMNNGGILGEHPDTNIPGIEFISGSLGHGLGVGVGFAIAAQMDNSDSLTYVVLGDGECYEGSIWEAAVLASHLKLMNLVVIVDRNRLCIHGDTEKINALDPLDKKWEAFGWNTKVINGHDIKQTLLTLREKPSTKPTALIANTIKGKGVSFMENKSEWHHGSINNEVLKASLSELSGE